ncbi:UDP-N-acetyl-D-galactosamine dehydrogenase [Geothermobacter ehrlichii]|uniref:UDP-N-acetyl-D-galactosamine dehydrogenase n=1 Tax=Geothermobacter ehrlichii TaxID=213224 RepID=A0A5D3WMH9_9BACT|nr:nucleotide sugar dehydrogenase [Geothermobacter ehrlichii]TYP00061.1 UDP-N-acetyl-D-galactosamine dehydrogenase [Geothermobacter ehrlichii]
MNLEKVVQDTGIAVVGLGYVGLPLAVAFARHLKVTGFDIDERKLGQLRRGQDVTGEVAPEDLKRADIVFTSDPAKLKSAAVVIVTVPTPIDSNRKPDLGPLRSACRTIGPHLAPGAVVVFESTVYPGVTEEECVPWLEEASGGKCGVDFKVAYSPERINPGDKVHTVENIVKVVAAQDAESLELVAGLYGLIVRAGIHRAPSIRVAEAAKVIENTQRDLNIALMNELALIFNRLGISTRDVLAAAGTKWNFLPFTPGLVGGHCIGVDPYYLTYKAEAIGYHPEVILAGRRINDGMGKYVAEMTVKKLIEADLPVKGSRVLVLGLTFKENCPDIRNSKVVDILNELRSFGVETLVYDPVADPEDARREYGVELLSSLESVGVDAVVWAVAHEAFRKLADTLPALYRHSGGRVLVDVKHQLSVEAARRLGLLYWSL